MDVIDSFDGKYRFLSNFAPAVVKFEGIIFPTVEHAYQAAKTLNVSLREQVRLAATPGIAKRMGWHLGLRPDWEDVKIDIMRDLLRQKFSLPKYRTLLIVTGDAELIEGNWWNDTFWGVCNGVGENHLGKLLMEIRSSFKSESGQAGKAHVWGT